MKGKLDSLIITSHMPRTSSLVAIFIAAGVCLRIGVAELALRLNCRGRPACLPKNPCLSLRANAVSVAISGCEK